MLKKILSLIALTAALFALSAYTFHPHVQPASGMDALVQEQAWVDSLLRQMTLDERLAQLVWVRANTDWPQDQLDAVARQIGQYQLGGVCFFNPSGNGTPEQQVELVNRFQGLMQRVPLFVTLDAEWGVGWRYRQHALAFPRQMMLGAIDDNRLLYEMGAAIARHCRLIGVHINLAPVADVNNNAANPVINYRSFGEDARRVAAKAYMYMRGMQDNGLMACAKHFPGHGDTDLDSHYDLPVIAHSRARLDSVELLPFKILAAQGVASIMVAHLQVPALDDTPNLPATLSRKTVADLLKGELRFNGLVMTDALEMKGVTKYHGAADAAAKALAAGNDVLLLPADAPSAIESMRSWISIGQLDSNEVFASVRKVLRWKYRSGLAEFRPLPTTGLQEALNDPASRSLKRELIRHALTLVRNDNDVLPLAGGVHQRQLASVAIGQGPRNAFQQRLRSYGDFAFFQTKKEISPEERRSLKMQLSGKDAVVVSLHGMSQRPSENYGLTQSAIDFVNELQAEVPVLLVAFGNAYALRHFDRVDAVLLAYEDDPDVQDLAAQAVFGAFAVQGRLPVTASSRSLAGQGLVVPSLKRFGYGLPEEVGLSSGELLKLDTLMEDAIGQEALPGGVVLIARKGLVVFQKAWGRHTYDPTSPATREDDVFDLASITKVAATTVSLMRLQDERRFDVRDPVEKYLHEFAGTNKSGIPMLRMLTHRARLTPWIRFYEATLDRNGQPSGRYYSHRQSEQFPWPVAKDLWLRADYPDTIWQLLRESPLLEEEGYRYSDLGFYIAGEVVRRLTGKPLEVYAAERFYEPLGMRTTTFRPLELFALDRIPPTEEDTYFRQRRVQGYVHDMGAAMLNQVSGHAGLFSDAHDLAILLQMLLNKGYYGGRQYIEPETIHYFTTRCGTCTRRGIGFDMPELKPGADPNVASKTAAGTFGHLGFTGSSAWVDPANELVFVFLSNRTYPSMFRKTFSELNLRPRLLDAVYEAME